MMRVRPRFSLFPYTTLFRSACGVGEAELVRLCVPAGQGGGGEGTRPCTAGRLRPGGRRVSRGGHGLVDGSRFFVRRGGNRRLGPRRAWHLGGLGGSVICRWAGCVGCGRGGGAAAPSLFF